MRKTTVFAILFTVFVSACVGKTEATRKTEQHFANQAEVKRIANSISSGSQTCDSPSFSSADRILSNMFADSFGDSGVIALWAAMVASAELELAEAALAANCLDYADKHFRNVMKTYSGRYYDGYRQRAQIGINDVRHKRN